MWVPKHLHLCMYVCMDVWMYIHTRTVIFIYIFIFLSGCIHVFIDLHMCK